MDEERDPFDIRDHTVIGTFSTDKEGKYCKELQHRRFFVEPDSKRPNFDVHHGVDEYELRFYSTSVKPVLEWMRDHRDELTEKDILVAREGDNNYKKKLNVDFVGSRDALHGLLQAASNINQVKILVTLCNGTYYIEHVKDTHESSPEDCFAGLKFGQYFQSVDGGPPDTTQPVGGKGAYYSVTWAQCGEHSMLFSSNTRAERKESTKRPPYNYVSIKTSKKSLTDKSFKRYKTLNWWSLAHVAGIPETCCGFRDNDARVISSVKMIKTEDLPGMNGDSWTAEDCQEKFHALLSDIKDKIKDDDPKAVYYLELEQVDTKNQSRDIITSRLSTRTFIHHGRRDDDYVIIPDCYLRQVLDMKE